MISAPTQSDATLADAGRKTVAYLRLCGLGPTEAEQLSPSPIGETLTRLDTWARTLVPAQPGESPAQHSARGQAQLLLAQVPSRWPGHFLRESPAPPPELSQAVQAATLQPVRQLRQSAMTPQPLDLGPVSEVADETWKTFDKWPVLRGLTMWVLFLLLLTSVFYVVRF